MGEENTQLAIIGAGPGGYVAAFLAADLGMKVTLIDKEPTLGGTCLSKGCIPSKALLYAAKIISKSKDAENFGITFNEPKINIEKLNSWKNSVVSNLQKGLEQLAKKRNINFICGSASFAGGSKIKIIDQSNAETILNFEKSIIATGSAPIMIKELPRSNNILDSTLALEINEIPENLLIVGGGYIGLELAEVYCQLGSKVTVCEMTESILPGTDDDLTRTLFRSLKEKLTSIKLKTKVISAKESNNKVTITFKTDQDTSNEIFDKVIVAIGRKPSHSSLNLDLIGVKIDDKGFVNINEKFETTCKNVFAIGDVCGGPMLAHKASNDAKRCIDALLGYYKIKSEFTMPYVVFTNPEIAVCGLTENQAKALNKQIKVTKFPWSALGKAIATKNSEGFIKLIVDPVSEKILGVSILGDNASELISQGVMIIENGLTAKEVGSMIFPHPSLSESFMEAAESFHGLCTHIYKPKR